MPAETEAAKLKPISMRHSKLKASEAALLAGELNKPSWQSKNEGIHERVSFEDSIWGFDLAGGSFYKTPLRVTAVKPDSRADKAGIRPGDLLLKINDIETATLTIQEAHTIIIDSGVHLKINVTCPDDEEDSYHCWQDPVEESGYDSEEERRNERERQKKREVHAKVSSYWSLQWPWVSKRRVIYRESNCFLVPSKYENNHRDKFSVLPTGPRVQDDLVHHSVQSLKTQQSIDESKQKEQEQQKANEQVGKEQENKMNNKQNGDAGLVNQSKADKESNNRDNVVDCNKQNGIDHKKMTEESINSNLNGTNNKEGNTMEGQNDLKSQVKEQQMETYDESEDLKEDADDDSELSETEDLDHSEKKYHTDEDITESQLSEDTHTQVENRIDGAQSEDIIETQEKLKESQCKDESFDSILDSESEVLTKDEEDRLIEDILSDSETSNLNENDER